MKRLGTSLTISRCVQTACLYQMRRLHVITIVVDMDFKHQPHPPKSPFPIGEGGFVIAHIIYVHN